MWGLGNCCLADIRSSEDPSAIICCELMVSKFVLLHACDGEPAHLRAVQVAGQGPLSPHSTQQDHALHS